MKTLILLLLLSSANIFATESVKIEAKKYMAFFKDDFRNDTAIYNLPVVTGGVSKDVMDKLNTYLSADSILGDNIDSVLAWYHQTGAGQVSCDYKIKYNQDGALSISVYIETLGAYPDDYYVDVNLNLNTGNRILLSDIILKESFKELAAKLNKVVQKRIKDKIKEEKIGAEDEDLAFKDKKFTIENFEQFSIVKDGIMFYMDYGLPHVIKAFTPDEEIYMSRNDLIEYYNSEGVLKDLKWK